MAEANLNFEVHLSDEVRSLEVAELYQLSQDVTGEPKYVPREFLPRRLSDASVIQGYSAELEDGTVIGHALIERPNPLHVPEWTKGTSLHMYELYELGRGFVHPEYTRQGVWTELIRHRLEVTRTVGVTAVAAVDLSRPYLARTLMSLGGVHVGNKAVADGRLALFRFDGDGIGELVDEDWQELAAVGVQKNQK